MNGYKMNYRNLGKTGLKMSNIVFGGGAVGGILIRSDPDVQREAIKRAIKSGINWIDTAPMYGNGVSEQNIGLLLGELSESVRPHIASKVMLNPEEADLSGQLEGICRSSLNRLNMNSIDLLQVHNRVENIFDGSSSLTVEQMLGPVRKGLENVRKKGLVRHIGFTANGDPEALKEVVNAGFYESAQVYYNMINPSAGRKMSESWPSFNFRNIISECSVQQMGVMVIRVLAAGVLATDKRNGRESEIIPMADIDSNQRMAKKIWDVTQNEVGTDSQTAIRYALSNNSVSGVVVGLAELKHLDEACEAAQLGRLSEPLLNTIHKTIDVVDST